jgi:hypothetical protein
MPVSVVGVQHQAPHLNPVCFEWVTLSFLTTRSATRVAPMR